MQYFFNFVFFIIVLSACNSGKNFKDNKEHVKLGQNFAGMFYKQVSKSNFDSATVFFSSNVSKTDILALLKQNKELFGTLKEIKFINANSDITETNHKLNGEMTLQFDAVYSRLSTIENITISVKNDELKIEGYNYKVNMDKLNQH